MPHTPLEALRAEYRELIGSMEYAFAMGHSHTLGTDPRLTAVRERAADLRARIAELTEGGGPDAPARSPA